MAWGIDKHNLVYLAVVKSFPPSDETHKTPGPEQSCWEKHIKFKRFIDQHF